MALILHIYLIMELKIIAHIPNLNTRRKINYRYNYFFNIKVSFFVVADAVFQISKHFFILYQKDFITPIPFTNSKVFEFNLSLIFVISWLVDPLYFEKLH